jgi:hypothetical protein
LPPSFLHFVVVGRTANDSEVPAPPLLELPTPISDLKEGEEEEEEEPRIGKGKEEETSLPSFS